MDAVGWVRADCRGPAGHACQNDEDRTGDERLHRRTTRAVGIGSTAMARRRRRRRRFSRATIEPRTPETITPNASSERPERVFGPPGGRTRPVGTGAQPGAGGDATDGFWISQASTTPGARAIAHATNSATAIARMPPAYPR